MDVKAHPTSNKTVAPLNIYGLSKLAGEGAVRTGNQRHIILRSSWVYSPYRQEFCSYGPTAGPLSASE